MNRGVAGRVLLPRTACKKSRVSVPLNGRKERSRNAKSRRKRDEGGKREGEKRYGRDLKREVRERERWREASKDRNRGRREKGTMMKVFFYTVVSIIIIYSANISNLTLLTKSHRPTSRPTVTITVLTNIQWVDEVKKGKYVLYVVLFVWDDWWYAEPTCPAGPVGYHR